MKKKLLSLAMIGVLVLGAACLTGCGKDDAQQEADTEKTTIKVQKTILNHRFTSGLISCTYLIQ